MSDVIIFDELLKDSPLAVIELFELHLDLAIHGSDTIYRFFNGVVVQTQTGEIIYQGKTYMAMPVEADGFEYKVGQSGFPRPTLRVGNLFSVVSALLENVNETTYGNDLTGAKVIRRSRLTSFLDDGNFDNDTNPYVPTNGTLTHEELPQEIYFVNRKVIETRDVVEFELAASLDLENIRGPKRQCLQNICQWQYKGGADGTLEGCPWRPDGVINDMRFYDESDNLLNATAATNFAYSSGDETLSSGSSLTAGQYLVSSNGWYRAQFGTKGDFFVYGKNNNPSNITDVSWRSETSGQAEGGFIKMGTNGDLFIRDAAEGLKWQTGTEYTGTLSTASFNGYLPDSDTPGRHATFYHEIFGNANDYAAGSQTRDRTFTLEDGRTVELRFTASSVELPANSPARTLGGGTVVRRWENPTDTFTAPVTVVSSTGNFRQNEIFEVSIVTSSSNPWRNQTLYLAGNGVYHEVGASYSVTASTGIGAKLVLQDSGNLQVQTTSGTVLWQSYSGRGGEPMVITDGSPLDDVCGKRLSSCKIRFGEYADLPFGSFPGVGTNLS